MRELAVRRRLEEDQQRELEAEGQRARAKKDKNERKAVFEENDRRKEKEKKDAEMCSAPSPQPQRKINFQPEMRKKCSAEPKVNALPKQGSSFLGAKVSVLNGNIYFTSAGPENMFCRPQRLRDKGFVLSQERLTPQQPYFEVKIINHCTRGIGIGLSEREFSEGNMPGWFVGSIGFHTDDGYIFLGKGGSGVPFGPTSSIGDIIGCGVIFSGTSPETIYYTRNGDFLGWVSVSNSEIMYPVVASSNPAVVQINLSASTPGFYPACTIERRGKTWRFTNILSALHAANEGDTIIVNSAGKHVLNETLVIDKSCVVQGRLSCCSAKPVLVCLKEHVVRCDSQNIILKNMRVESVGGDSSERIAKGAAGVVISSGAVQLENCEISCEEGSGIAILRDGDCGNWKQTYSLKVIDCSILNCGRHGIILHQCTKEVLVKSTSISNCRMFGVALNVAGTYSLEDCVIENCNSGVIMLASKAKLVNIRIFRCQQDGLRASSTSDTLLAELQNCLIESCQCGIRADGDKARVQLQSSCSIRFCEDEVIQVSGAHVAAMHSVSPSFKGRKMINIESKIKSALSKGVPLYHSGDAGSCKNVYLVCCKEILPHLNGENASKVQYALRQSAGTSNEQSSLILRRVLDSVLDDISPTGSGMTSSCFMGGCPGWTEHLQSSMGDGFYTGYNGFRHQEFDDDDLSDMLRHIFLSHRF